MRRANAIVLAVATALLCVVACLDTTPPTVTITYPANGASPARDTIRIKAYATDNVGVTKVEFSVDGTLLSTQTSGNKDTFSYLWDADSAAVGSHGIVVTAYDNANNHSRDSISVTFQSSDVTPPAVTITHPSNGASLARDTIRIKAYATDNIGVTKVEFRVDASLLSTQTNGTNDTFSYLWDATSAAVGGHAITARAYDAANNTKQDSVSVTLTGGGGGGPTHHSGEISADETWHASGNPHIIDDDVYVDNNATLTIEPGCVVKFTSGTELYCGNNSAGAIVAAGTPSATILFTSNNASPAPGDWSRIGFYDHTMSNTRFAHCMIEYGGTAGANGGELYVQNNRAARVDSCTIRKSGDYGIVCYATGSSFASLTGNAVITCAKYPIDIYPNDIRVIDPTNTLTGNTTDGIWVEPGVGGNAVTASETWGNFGVPYILSADVEVAGPSGPVLTIVPGTTIELTADVELYCGNTDAGAISAVGTAANPIIFTSARSSRSPGDWSDIGLYAGTTINTRFSYCTFEYGGTTGSNNGEVYIDGNRNATFDHCTIDKSGDFGIVCHSSGSCPSGIHNCTITTCARYPIDIYPNDIGIIDATSTWTGNTNEGIWVEPGVGGNAVVNDATWWALGVPYCLSSDVEVAGPTGPILTIAPGVTIKLASDVELYCGNSDPGNINAAGTAASPITFTSLLASPAPGSWKDVGFYSGSGVDSRMEYCTVAYGGGDQFYNGDLYLDNVPASMDLQRCTFSNSAGYGIYLDGPSYPDSSQLETNNTFSNDPSGHIRKP